MIGIGLDIGATKTLGVLADASGKVLAQVRRPTSPGPAGVLATAEAVIGELRPDGDGLWPIGIGIPGLVDPALGAVRHAVNLDLNGDWLMVAHELEARLGHAVLVENDVKAAALGATTLLPEGAPADLAYLSVGTGLAAALVLDGRLRRGMHGAAGEIGHVPVDPAGLACSCGQRGCLETMGAGPALPGLGLDRFAEAVAAAVRLICLTVDVEAVVIGGGVAGIGEPLRVAVAAALDKQAVSSPFLQSLRLADRLSVVPADYPVAAVGAAFLGRPA